MSIYRRHNPEGLPSLITTNTSGRRPLFQSDRACSLLIETLYQLRAEEPLLILALVVMPDHLHLIAKHDRGELGRVTQLIKGRFSRTYNRMLGRRGACWQSRYHERTLRTEGALMDAIDYVHWNPVTAGLVRDAEQYRWSTAGGRYETDLVRYLGGGEEMRFGQAKA